MFELIEKKLFALTLATVVAGLLSSCGNKGDLFLVPDQMTQEELLRLEQSLDGSGTSPLAPDSIDGTPTVPVEDTDGSEQPSRKSPTTSN